MYLRYPFVRIDNIDFFVHAEIINNLTCTYRWYKRIYTYICMFIYTQVIFWGPPPPNALEFYVPLPTPFLLDFWRFWKFGVDVRHFFRKIAQKFQTSPEILSSFSKSKKNYYFCIQISPKSLYWWTFGQIFPQNSKNGQFFVNTRYFFGAFGATKFGDLCPKSTKFFGVGVLPWAGVPQKYLWYSLILPLCI